MPQTASCGQARRLPGNQRSGGSIRRQDDIARKGVSAKNRRASDGAGIADWFGLARQGGGVVGGEAVEEAEAVEDDGFHRIHHGGQDLVGSHGGGVFFKGFFEDLERGDAQFSVDVNQGNASKKGFTEVV